MKGLAALLAALPLSACGRPATDDVAPARQAVAQASAWSEVASMGAARQGLTATPLADGRVLIAGGQRIGAVDVGDVFWETAELYDDGAAAFTPVASKMKAKRFLHVAASLADGRVLAAGGVPGGELTAEVWSPKAKTWTLVASLAHPRVRAAAVTLANGRVLVTGGGAMSQEAEVYDPASGTWSPAGVMLEARCGHTATLLSDGRVLSAGGEACADGSVLGSAEIYDPATGQWAAAAPMKEARTLHAAVRLETGRVMVIGGSSTRLVEQLGALSSVEVFAPAQNAWTALPPMAAPRALHTATGLDNGAVLVAGGADDTASVLRSTELYDPDAKLWISPGEMAHDRLSHAAAALPGGVVLVAGGENQSSAEVYRPLVNGQSCQLGRQCASGFCVDGVCCNDVCKGQCVTCALPGAEGACSKAAAGTDPHHDCGQGGPCDDVCDEAGLCADRVGEVCVSPSCVEGGARAIEEATCSARGAACEAREVDCAPYRCGVDGSSGEAGCLTRCASITDCADGYACDPEGHCRLRPDVAAAEQGACAAATGEPPPQAAALWLIAAVAAASRRAAPRAGRRPS